MFDSPRRLWPTMLLLAVIVFVAAAAGLTARATYGAQTTADEPQYLLSAISLAHDGDLDISNQLSDRVYEDFHEVRLNEQTYELDASGRRISPHDPLLPAILAPAVALGGWMGAKIMLAVIASVTAAVTLWTAVRRFGLDTRLAAVVTGACFVGMPLVSYGTQIYPEMPAALAVVVIVAAIAGPGLGRGHVALVMVGIVALPWLSVKYVPVATVIAVLLLARLVQRRQTVAVVVVAGVALISAAVYAWFHQRVYGGWTAYAAGDHFVERGEFAVVGGDPDYVGRSRRIVGLLVDRRYGLIGWAPVWLLLPAGFGWCIADRGQSRWRRAVVLVPLATGWATATFVALSMHSWWSPGRQIVVVAPLAVIAIAMLVCRFRWLVGPVIVAGLLGLVNWWWLVWEASTARRTIVVDFFETDAPPYRVIATVLAQGWPSLASADAVRTAWAVVLGVSCVAAVGAARRGPDRRRWMSTTALVIAAVATIGWFGADDGERTRPADIYRPDKNTAGIVQRIGVENLAMPTNSPPVVHDSAHGNH